MPLTDDKSITTKEYWASIYEGKRNDKPTDASNFKRPVDAFDRFQWLADQVVGPEVLDCASGHATTMKRLRAMHPDWKIVCSDQTEAAKKAANWDGGYHIISVYDIGILGGVWNTITASQCIEYFEFPDKFMEVVKEHADYFVCTVPAGIMSKWSQLREWNEESLKEWLSQYGEIVHFDKVPGLMLAKVKLNG